MSSRFRNGATSALPGRQRGVALLVAILLVALGTIIAAAIAYENAMTARRGATTLEFDQAVLVAQGAEALAAFGLREVYRQDQKYTHLAQKWTEHVGPVEVVPGMMLEAQLEDLQGRFNLNSLVASDGSADADAVAAFERLLASLDIEPKWAGYLVDWIDPDSVPQPTDGAEDSVYLGQNPPYHPPNLYITSASELLALPGFGRERYEKLARYVTALPPADAKLNVCTADGKVLDAFTGKQEFGLSPDQLLKNRLAAGTCFPKIADYAKSFDSAKTFTKVRVHFVERSSYFRLASFITIGTAEFNLYSLLYMDGSAGTDVKFRPILRSFSPD